MNLVKTAQNRTKIMAAQDIHCPVCNARQFSPFDKLYVSAYGKCVDCSSPQEVEKNGDNIFKIIEA